MRILFIDCDTLRPDHLGCYGYGRNTSSWIDEIADKGAMIRNEKYKYIARVSGEDELYDLENDKEECINIINSNEHNEIVSKMQKELMHLMLKTSDVVPINHDDRFNFHMKWAKLKQYVPETHIEEYKTKLKSGKNVFLLMQECQKRFKV